MERVVSPVDQVYPVVDSEEVSTTPVPGQIFVEPPAVMVGVAVELPMETVAAVEVAMQLPELTVTLYDPALVTVIDCVVSLVDHLLPVVLLDVSVTLPPGQNERGPFALTTGCGMVADALTVMADDVATTPDLETFTA